ncbi:MAG TPA: UPF0758 domain-containing protein [Kofleriaceae bacterium]|nr:UPF0758 domain-containing protein [Kofleriaceae bacterium]
MLVHDSRKSASRGLARALLRCARVTLAHDRPRERLLRHGGDPLSCEDLIALILGTGARGKSAVEVARLLLEQTGGLVDLARANPRELARVRGIGEARAARLVAAFQLGKRARPTRGYRAWWCARRPTSSATCARASRA